MRSMRTWEKVWMREGHSEQLRKGRSLEIKEPNR